MQVYTLALRFSGMQLNKDRNGTPLAAIHECPKVYTASSILSELAAKNFIALGSESDTYKRAFGDLCTRIDATLDIVYFRIEVVDCELSF